MKLKIKFNQLNRAILLLYCSAVAISACTSDEQQPQDPVAAEEGEAQEGDEATAEGAEETADANDSETADTNEGESEAATAGESEEIKTESTEVGADSAPNSIAEAEAAAAATQATEEIVPESSEASAATEDLQAKDSVAEPVPQTAESAEYGTNAAPVAVPMEAASSGPIEPGSGRVVRYVRPDSLSIHQSSSDGSPAVGNLKRGDVVLVTYNGDWARLDNGSFVTAKALSSKGIGKRRANNSWNSQK